METRAKSNAEFRSEVQEILARHETNFEQVHATMQAVLTEVQAMRIQNSQPSSKKGVNSSLIGESSHNPDPIPQTQAITSTYRNPNRDLADLKLPFPKFSGEDPMGWVYRTGQYFEFKDIPTSQRVHLASFHLEGVALKWHRWVAKIRGLSSWEEFTKTLLQRFGPTDYEDPSEALTRLKQVSNVAHYQENFEQLSHKVDGLPEHYLVGCFVAGLRDDIRLDVKIKQPRTLSDAIGVARLVEERNTLQRRGGL